MATRRCQLGGSQATANTRASLASGSSCEPADMGITKVAQVIFPVGPNGMSPMLAMVQ
jgi:hypothetical protein